MATLHTAVKTSDRLSSMQSKDAAAQATFCEICGQPARVHILEAYADGKPVSRRFCLPCAASNPAPLALSRPRTARLRMSSLLALAAIVMGVVATFGDSLAPEAHAGFGWHQRGGVALGAIFLLVGTLMRADVIALGGAFLFGASLCADWLGITRAPGIGWKQQLLLGISAVCMLAALLGRVVDRLQKSHRPSLPNADRQSHSSPEAERAAGV